MIPLLLNRIRQNAAVFAVSAVFLVIASLWGVIAYQKVKLQAAAAQVGHAKLEKKVAEATTTALRTEVRKVDAAVDAGRGADDDLARKPVDVLMCASKWMEGCGDRLPETASSGSGSALPPDTPKPPAPPADPTPPVSPAPLTASRSAAVAASPSTSHPRRAPPAAGKAAPPLSLTKAERDQLNARLQLIRERRPPFDPFRGN